MGWYFLSQVVLRCTNGHQIEPIYSCLCLWDGAFTRILYFNVQTGTKSNQFLAVYVYEVVLFLASCTLMYKQAPKQTNPYLFKFTGWCFQWQLVLRCTNMHQNKANFSCLYYGLVLLLASCTLVYKRAPKQAYFQLLKLMGWCFYSHLLLRCTNRHQIKPIFFAVNVYGVVIFLASCTSMYKQAPKQTYLYLFIFTGWCF